MFRYAQPDEDGLDAFLDDAGAARPARRSDPALIGGVEAPAAGRGRRGLGFALPVRFGLTGPALAGAMMLTVGGNALFMQHGPHPAPLLGDSPPAPAAAATAETGAPVTVASIPLPTARPAQAGDEDEHAAAAFRTGDHVRETQRLLAVLGYYDGPPDGIAGPRTIGALKRYESENGLVAAGDVNEAVLGHIRLTADRRAAAGKTGGDAIADLVTKDARTPPPAAFDERIAEVQRVLAMLGYSPGPVDGQLGPGTRDAIIRFRRDNNLPALGEIDAVLIHALQEFSGVKLARGA